MVPGKIRVQCFLVRKRVYASAAMLPFEDKREFRASKDFHFGKQEESNSFVHIKLGENECSLIQCILVLCRI